MVRRKIRLYREVDMVSFFTVPNGPSDGQTASPRTKSWDTLSVRSISTCNA